MPMSGGGEPSTTSAKTLRTRWPPLAMCCDSLRSPPHHPSSSELMRSRHSVPRGCHSTYPSCSGTWRTSAKLVYFGDPPCRPPREGRGRRKAQACRGRTGARIGSPPPARKAGLEESSPYASSAMGALPLSNDLSGSPASTCPERSTRDRSRRSGSSLLSAHLSLRCNFCGWSKEAQSSGTHDMVTAVTTNSPVQNVSITRALRRRGLKLVALRPGDGRRAARKKRAATVTSP